MTTIYKTAILGASGYTGAELIRLIHTHPALEIAALTADRKAGQALGAVFPHLGHLD
ncbi:MAG: N-acetyl-gamma-glutamyl-phosphate reductase, partial [Pseudomonadota bacterium]